MLPEGESLATFVKPESFRLAPGSHLQARLPPEQPLPGGYAPRNPFPAGFFLQIHKITRNYFRPGRTNDGV